MAQPMVCDGPDNDAAVFIITNTQNGDTIAMCGTCIVDWSVAILQMVSPESLAAPAGGQAGEDPGGQAADGADGSNGKAGTSAGAAKARRTSTRQPRAGSKTG